MGAAPPGGALHVELTRTSHVGEDPAHGLQRVGVGAAAHHDQVRGLMSTKRSPFFEGHFGRMFRALPMAKFGTTDDENIKNLTGLGSAMSADFDPPKDGKDDEESGIPALYTYLGQFIDHDITFDPASVLQKQNDPDALVDFRTPALDLDNVYG